LDAYFNNNKENLYIRSGEGGVQVHDRAAALGKTRRKWEKVKKRIMSIE
jgi:hypothetical protein